MGEINFARVDARLVHGQVTTAWSNSVGINAIYVVDDPTANDDFTKMLYTNLQNNYSFKIKVFTVEEVIKYWNKTEFEKDKVMLLFKDVKHAVETAKSIPYKNLNIGGSPKTPNNKVVTPDVALSKEEFYLLKELENNLNIEVYFQTMPSSGKKKLKEVKY